MKRSFDFRQDGRITQESSQFYDVFFISYLLSRWTELGTWRERRVSREVRSKESKNRAGHFVLECDKISGHAR